MPPARGTGGDSLKTVFQYLKSLIPRIILQVMIKLSGTITELLLPGLLSSILDNYAAVNDLPGVWKMGGLMLLCAIVAWLANVIANKMATGISRDFIIRLRRDLYTRISGLSASQRNRITDASLISRLTTDTYNVHNMVDRMQRLGIRAPIMLLGGILVSLTLDPVLTLVLICTLPLLILVVVWSSKKGVPMFTAVQEQQDKMVRKVQESMTGARVIRALSRGHTERESFSEINNSLSEKQRTADTTMAVVSPLTGLILNAGLSVVVLVGARRVAAGLSQPGSIIAFLSYFTIILNAMLSITRIFVLYSKGSASARRIESVLREPEDLLCLPCTEDCPADAAHLTFEHVTFSYHHTTPNVEDLSFSVDHGQTLGIIGPTGSGKSTLLSLILRLYDPDSGKILLDGRPLTSLTRDELCSGVGIVFQNDFLIADTVRENIRFGREIDDTSIESAIDCAQAGFIREKENGLGFMLNVGGHNLSGGQQQRVLISRAVAGDPRLLLLDDCSSALDYRTDRSLRQALRERHGQATTVIVAQRVSSVMTADRILVMENGRIIGNGTHQELMDSCPSYRELVRIQLGGDAV